MKTNIICFFRRWQILIKLWRIKMALAEVLQRQELTLNKVKAVDAIVEALFQQIKDLTGDGVTEAAAALLLAKQDEIDAALGKVETDDDETPPTT